MQITKPLVIKIAIAAVVAFVIWRIMHKKSEHFADFDAYTIVNTQETLKPEALTTQVPVQVSTTSPLALSTSLLPKPEAKATAFGEFAPKDIGEAQFLDASKFIGVDTQGSSLRNASRDLRREPPIAKADVGIWNASTIQSDPWRRPLDC